MSSFNLNSYKLVTLLSENDLCQSWLAESEQSGEKYFLKIAGLENSFDQNQAKSLLIRSYQNQKSIICEKINTATKKSVENGTLIIEYPYLDPAVWKPVDYDLFWRNWREILIESFNICEFLHCLGFVHADLNLTQFLQRQSSSRAELCLADLDFLSVIGTRLQARLFGTPDHIPPEVKSNEEIVAQSDGYSLGMSLKKYLHWLENENDQISIDNNAKESLINLTAELTRTDPLARPLDLTDVLFRNNLVSEAELEEIRRSTIQRLLINAGATSVQNSAVDSLKSIFTKYHMLGLHYELVEKLEEAAGKSASTAYTMLDRIVREASITRISDYWLLSLDDRKALAIFEELDRLNDDGKKKNRKIPAIGDIKDLTARYRDAVNLLLDSEKTYLPFIKLKQFLADIELSSLNQVDAQYFLETSGLLAFRLGRAKEAYRYYSQLLDLLPETDPSYLRLLVEKSLISVRIGDTEAGKIIEQGIKLSDKYNNNQAKASFLRSKGWLRGWKNNDDDAIKILKEALDLAFAAPSYKDVISIYYVLGVVLWSLGKIDESIENLKEAIRTAEREDLKGEAIYAVSFLAFMYYEMGNYSKSINQLKWGLKQVKLHLHAYTLPYISIQMAIALSRLCQHKKAGYWLQQFVNSGLDSQSPMDIVTYHSGNGFLNLNAGRIRGALADLQKCENVFTGKESSRARGKVYHNKAEIAIYLGDPEVIKKQVEKARNIFVEYNDEDAVIEINLIESLGKFYYSSEVSALDLMAVFDSLKKPNHAYYRAVCAYHILMTSDSEARQTVLAELKPELKSLLTSQVPLFKVIGFIAQADDISELKSDYITTLKSVYITLYSNGYPFLALLTCRKIAQIYKATGKKKRARKFFTQAGDLAQKLGNKIFENKLKDESEKISDNITDKSSIIDSLWQVSKILKDSTHYRDGLHRILEFAVDQTGAERGAILIGSGSNNQNLQIKSYVNCDEQSLADIVDFSSKIPMDVLRSMRPVVVKDAQQSSETKHYKSVIQYNILSVMCIPIVKDGLAQGVIYLDHHTIPALFEDSDLAYAEAISNFSSILISSMDKFRVAIQTGSEYESAGGKEENSIFVTESENIEEMLSELPRIANSDANVLLLGESGTGKEILCNLIHRLSGRSGKPVVKLNCAAISSNMMESELFGIVDKAATGVSKREGKFEAADGGTLFLDEIADMPLSVQAMVLRVIENKCFERVGSNQTIYTDVRMVFATNHDLKSLVEAGKFRKDLYYRIKLISIEIPSLRQRTEDIIPLLEHFLKIQRKDQNLPIFSPSARQALQRYTWPGNVRQLRNEIDRCCILYPGKKIEVSMLSPEITSEEVTDEKELISRSLIRNDWNFAKTARELNIPRTNLRRKIEKYGLKKP